MIDRICIFESTSFSNLLPLVYFRPQYDLRCGILTLKEKVQITYSKIPISLQCRNYLTDLVIQQNKGLEVNNISSSSCLFINGQIIVDKNLKDIISLNGKDTLYLNGETIVAAKVSGKKLEALKLKLDDFFTLTDFSDLFKKEINAKVINYPWDLIKYNGEQIISDFKLLTRNSKKKLKGKIYKGAHLINKKDIFIDDGAKIKPGVVLDAEEGPIYIGKNAIIYPNAVIEGPALVGNNSLIKIGSKIYENTSIGEVCKVGGEVEDSIIHSYSNKQHDGFLGHSYLGMWVNLGADTNNSDLKNNYGNIKVIINGEQIDSGSMFVGLTMGDHSKSAINTMFNTGTVVGVSSNIFGAGFPPKYIPSFSWGGSENLETYGIERSIDVAKRVMARRKIVMTDAEEKLFRKLFELTKDERKKFNMTTN